jgi:predicted ATPase
VQGVLAARIDRLTAAEKDLLHQVAILGRQFPLSLVRQVVTQPEEELYRLLASLQRKEFLYEQPAFPEVEYIFKHALTQEVAYNSVLHERRKALHERTAQAIEALYSANLDEHYSELAHHYSRSGNTEKAIEYLQLAGQQAVQRSAHVEAITHLTAALELLTTLPDARERAQQELTLQLALGAPLIATKGYGAPEVEKAYSRARELCRHGAETSALFPVLLGLWVIHFVRAELRLAHELGEQLLRQAHGVQDPLLLLEAHFALGQTLFCLGELLSARSHLEQGLTLYNPQQHGVHVSHYGQDMGVGCRRYEAWALWVLGYPDQALTKSQEALALAQELAHPLSLGFAFWWGAVIEQYCRRGQAAQERAEAAITLSTEQEFAQILAHGTILRGWALAEQGQEEEGIQQIQQGMAAAWATGTGTYRPYHLALLAEAYGKAGQVEEGLTALAEALTVVNKTGERYYEAELDRLKGELTLQQFNVQGLTSNVKNSPESEGTNSPATSIHSPASEAEEYFLKAIEVAQKQQAKSLELRATMSLARLWQSQGKRTEAHQLLSEIYGWFTEGFETKDLQEAQALLDELARSV